ncbi:MAG: putative toxin-antitoxin system toxin component, PIN family [Thermoguttaceae bacterium]|jgi:putative PIN family toxin of toxin-antitoxin system
MKIVLDTNVLISALITRGVCRDLLEHCVQRHQIIISDFILNEVRENLQNKFHFDAQEIDEAVALFSAEMQTVSPALIEKHICRDPQDDMILGTAITGNAECIITGDEDLLVLGQYGQVRILSPAKFADFEARRK